MADAQAKMQIHFGVKFDSIDEACRPQTSALPAKLQAANLPTVVGLRALGGDIFADQTYRASGSPLAIRSFMRELVQGDYADQIYVSDYHEVWAEVLGPLGKSLENRPEGLWTETMWITDGEPNHYDPGPDYF